MSDSTHSRFSINFSTILGKSFQCIFIVIAITFFWTPRANGQNPMQLNQDQNTSLLGDSLELFVELIPGKIQDNGFVTLKLWGRVAEGYHIYSIFPQGDYSPEPTQLLMEISLLVANGPLSESEPIWVKDEAFNERLKVHKNDFWLERVYRVRKGSKSGKYEVRGSLIFQVCNNKICSLPVSKPFTTFLEILEL